MSKLLLLTLCTSLALTAQITPPPGGGGGGGVSQVVIAGTANEITVMGTCTITTTGTCTLSIPNPFIAPGLVEGSGFVGTDLAHTGYIGLIGFTGGGAWGFTVPDATSTNGLYVTPTTVTNGDFLKVTGTTTCPTLVSGAPSTCYATSWAAPTAYSNPFLSTVTFSATPTYTVNAGSSPQIFNLSTALSANITASTLTTTNAQAGQDIGFIFTQGASTAYTNTLPSSVTGCAISPTLNSVTEILGTWNGSAMPVSLCLTSDTFMSMPASVAPASPASGYGNCWFDSTALVWQCKNSSGVVSSTLPSWISATTGSPNVLAVSGNETLSGSLTVTNTVLRADGTIAGTNIATPGAECTATIPCIYPKGGTFCSYNGTTETCGLGGSGISPTGTGVVQISSGVAATTYSPTQYRIPFDSSTGLQDLSGFTFTPGSPNVLAVPGGETLTARLTISVTGNGLTLSGGSTGAVYPAITNSGGILYYGLEDSVGGGLFAGGLSYAAGFGTNGTHAVEFATNSTVNMALFPSGGLNLSSAPLDPGAYVFKASTSSLATTPTANIISANTTLATSGVPVQVSPIIEMAGNVWNTTATAANNTSLAGIYNLPVSGTTPSATMEFGFNLNGGGWTFPMSLTSGGVLTFSGTAPITAANQAATGTGDVNVCWKTTGVYTQGSVCGTSLEETKNNIRALSHGADELMRLQPIVYDQGGPDQMGFGARATAAVDPLLGAYRANGDLYNFSDRAILSLTVKTVQDQQVEIERLRAELEKVKR